MEITTFFQDKTVLVTGAAGFIGSHLCQQLLAAKAHVIGVDNFLTGHQRNLDDLQCSYHPNFSFIRGDVTQPIESYLPASSKIDVILHFASPASPPRYQAHPVETYLVNSLGTHYLLQFLKEHHPEARLLFASTSEVYGDPEIHPQTENYWGHVNPNGKRSCYDEAKRLGETICGVHQRDFGLDVRIVRIFNTYGPQMDPLDGRIIPNLISNALRHEPLTIYGDGLQTRSYCFVDDLVNGLLQYAALPNMGGRTINLGNPEEYTILQTAELIFEAINGRKPDHATDFIFQPLPSDDPLRRRPDITVAKQQLGWEPSIPFQVGLAKTIEFFKSL